MAQKLIPVTELTKKVATLYRNHFMDFFRVLVWLLIPTSLLSLLPLLPISWINTRFLEIILTIVTALVSLWLSVIMVDLISTYSGKEPNEKIVQKISWGTAGRVVDFVLVSILQGLVVGIGLLLFVVPGIIFWNWFSFSRYTLLVDGTSPGSQSLRASKELVSGRFGSIAWRWIGSYLYFGSFIALGTIAILAIIGALLGNPSVAFSDESIWWSNLIVNVISIFATPLFVAIGFILYEDAKRTR